MMVYRTLFESQEIAVIAESYHPQLIEAEAQSHWDEQRTFAVREKPGRAGQAVWGVLWSG